MSCIFESNLRNNPNHNRHILREEFDGQPFIRPEKLSDEPPEDEDTEEMEELDGENQLPDDMERVEDVPEWAICYLMYNDDSGLDEQDLEDVNDWLEQNGYSELVSVEDGSENGFSSHPAFGKPTSTCTVIMRRDEGIGIPSEENKRGLNMESCVMGSNLFGHGNYGRAILREMAGDLEEEETVRDHIASMFNGTPGLAADAEQYMTDNGYDLEGPASEVSDDEWMEMSNAVIGDEYFEPEEDPNAELAAASDYADENPYQRFDDNGVPEDDYDEVGDEGYEEDFDDDSAFDDDDEIDRVGESYELHSALTTEGEPTYEEPEVKKEPKLKPPTLTAKRNRRLRSKSRNIQLWNNKKKCFDPKYINTRFTRMSDANEAIKKIGESCECGRKDCKCGCTPLARPKDYYGTKTLRKAKRLKRKALPPGQVYEDEK